MRKTCALPGCINPTGKDNKYCCTRHYKIGTVLNKLKISLEAWERERNKKYKCATCGRFRKLNQYRDPKKPLGITKHYENCKECRDGKLHLKAHCDKLNARAAMSSERGALKMFDRDGVSYVTMLSGYLGVEIFGGQPTEPTCAP